MNVPKGRELAAVGVFAGIAFTLLMVSLAHFLNQDFSRKSYLLSLNGESTYSNYPVSALVDDSQTINIFGLNNLSAPDDITLTDMIGEKGNIKTSNIEPKAFPKSSPQNQTEPIKVQLTVSDTKPGLFQGLMMVRESKNASLVSIPLSITSDTVTNYAVIWILIGVFSSFIFWEFMKVNQKKNVRTRLETLKENTTKLFGQTNFDLESVIENIVEMANYERINLYLNSRYTTRVGVSKIALVDILSVLFGIAVGFIGLLNNDYLNNMRFITTTNILVLFGIGLGIGSLKELVDKAN